MKNVPHIRHSPGFGRAEVRFPFNRIVNDELKRRIPSHERAWEPDKKCWLIASSWVNRVRRLLEQEFGSCRVETHPAGTGSADYQPTPIRPTDRAYEALHLLPSAPWELVESSFRTLAKRVHPDAGGTDAAMRELNEAVATLRERRLAS